MLMDYASVSSWIDDYFAAWATNNPSHVAGLFSPEAVYQTGPFSKPWRGRDEIVTRWTAGRTELLRHTHNVLAIDGDHAVIRWNVVVETKERPLEIDGILVLVFDDNGLCRERREWHVSRTF